ncbi:MAG: arsenosugar biosynthesis radical SAM protein ArsS [Acidobacteria bacterium]|nr:arsenosugar biosynthesis radical SAM protein ArsS [Acidobacteriota bacterium]
MGAAATLHLPVLPLAQPGPPASAKGSAVRRSFSEGGSSTSGGEFAKALREHGLAPLVRARVTTLQVNVGKFCNMACHHCHVEAGPKRTEMMPRQVAERVVTLLEQNPGVEIVDLTGGAPELNPNFRWLVRQIRRLDRRIIDRCNLTVLFEPGMEDLAEFLAAHEVHIVASLPCYQAENVEKQRGRGAFEKSIAALKRLNVLGYGQPGSALELDLVYNPLGAFLPPPQAALEANYKEELARLFGIEFRQLLTITNMPIKRFADFLERTGKLEAYMGLLVNHFNPATVPELMCRSLLSVAWNGTLHDCDFNQMLDIALGASSTTGARTIWDMTSLEALTGCRVATGSHCFGCTAGAGSSCGGALR